MTGQATRQIEFISEYDNDIQHRAGTSHGNCDSLSRRLQSEECGAETVELEGLESHFCYLRAAACVNEQSTAIEQPTESVRTVVTGTVGTIVHLAPGHYCIDDKVSTGVVTESAPSASVAQELEVVHQSHLLIVESSSHGTARTGSVVEGAPDSENGNIATAGADRLPVLNANWRRQSSAVVSVGQSLPENGRRRHCRKPIRGGGRELACKPPPSNLSPIVGRRYETSTSSTADVEETVKSIVCKLVQALRSR